MKKWIGLLLALLMLTGCGSIQTPETTAPTEPPTEAAPTEVFYIPEPTQRVYGGAELRLYLTLEETDEQIPVLLQAAELFEAQTGAKVHLILMSPEDLAEKIAAGEADIFQANTLEPVKDQVLDLTELAAARDYDSHSFQALRSLVTEELGFLGAIPWIPRLGGVYYNQEAFRSCGVTEYPGDWGEFLTLCQTLEQGGWKPLTMDQEDARTVLELHLLGNLGRERLEGLLGSKSWQQDQEAIAVIQQVVDFVKAGYLAKGTPAAYPGGQNRMGLSNVAMAVMEDRDCRDIETQTLADLSWGVFPYPGTGVTLGAELLCVSKACSQPEAALDFILLLATGEFDQLRADITGGIPADPGNESVIENAVAVLQNAQRVSLGLLGEGKDQMSRYLWQGWYGSGSAFAKVWDQSK